MEEKKKLEVFYYRGPAKIKESERHARSCKDLINVVDKRNGFLELSTNSGEVAIGINKMMICLLLIRLMDLKIYTGGLFIY